MSKIRPYIALDLETTGLCKARSEILQIGAVFDDGVSNIPELETLNILVERQVYTYAEPVALAMNAWIFQELRKKPEERNPRYEIGPPGPAMVTLIQLLSKAAKAAEKWDAEQGLRPRGKVQIAGKNPGSFDWPILYRSAEQMSLGGNLSDYVDHRFLDAGCIFYSQFGRNPGLNSINKLTGRNAVTHDALEDALDIVHAVRHAIPE